MTLCREEDIASTSIIGINGTYLLSIKFVMFTFALSINFAKTLLRTAVVYYIARAIQ